MPQPGAKKQKEIRKRVKELKEKIRQLNTEIGFISKPEQARVANLSNAAVNLSEQEVRVPLACKRAKRSPEPLCPRAKLPHHLLN